ncbi:MAG: hypothetical protein R3B96_07520 [Pirellulaceae bacterium]
MNRAALDIRETSCRSTIKTRRSNTSSSRRSRRVGRAGITLLEVILSIAILGGALAVIGELVRLGTRAALAAHETTIAHVLADSRMAEVAAGAVELANVSSTTCEESPDWVYSIEIQQTQQVGLLMVVVFVQQDPARFAYPIGFRLYRMMPDPEYVQQLEDEYEVVY